MNKTSFYRILLSVAGFCLLGLVCTRVAVSQSSPASADSNRPPSSVAEPNQPAQADPNAPSGGNAELPDPSFSEETADSRIPAFFDACDRLFEEYVTKEGLVKYAALRRNRRILIQIARMLKEVSPLHLMTLEPEAQTAFWINTYNFCTLKLIIDNYPIQPKWYMIRYPDNSIMQISDPWNKHFFEIQGVEYTLKEMEQEFLLNRTLDPRICFALTNASLGGGRLRQQAYRPETLDKQLNEQVRQYLQSPFGYKQNAEENIIHLSVLFQTKRKTFLDSEYAQIKRFRDYPDLQRTWLNFLTAYLPRGEVDYIENNTCTFKMINYDWHLDEGN